MCGIGGVFGKELIAQSGTWPAVAYERMAHRGPDDGAAAVLAGGEWQVSPSFRAGGSADASAILLHRRLAILDLSAAGRQPMVSADGRYAIVFNGEIYNYLELRAELEAIGIIFQTRTDTEVLLQAVICWGLQPTLRKLEGMYAFCVVDRRDNLVNLARDPFGIKPLYYRADGAGVVFASSFSSLLEWPGGPNSLNAAACLEFLSSGTSGAGGDTFVSEIRQVEAGMAIEFSLANGRELSRTCHWTPPKVVTWTGSYADATAELRKILAWSVKLHMRSDVPLGIALSGGIDSSAIACLAREVAPGTEIHTFSYIGVGSESEEHWVDCVAEKIGSTQNKIRPSSAGLAAESNALMAAQEQPFTTTSIYAQYKVYQAAREAGIVVMLDGQGADELLGGYEHLAAARLASMLRGRQFARAGHFLKRGGTESRWKRSRLLRNAAAFLIPPKVEIALRNHRLSGMMSPYANRDWVRKNGVVLPALRSNESSEILRAVLGRASSRGGLAHLLRYQDCNSMAHSVEGRVPFLTRRLADFVLGLPEEYLVSDGSVTKRILRDAMRGTVPDAVLDRKDKIGFQTPEGQWIREGRQWLLDLLAQAPPAACAMLDISRVERDVTASGAVDGKLWRAISMLQWLERNQQLLPVETRARADAVGGAA